MKLQILVCSLALAFATAAGALTLNDLANGANFTAGALSFGDFSVSSSGAVDSNLADYQVQPLSDGFRILGGFGAFDGDQGSLHISYQVTDSAAGGVDGLGLRFDGAAAGKGSGAMVTDNVYDSSSNHVAAADVFGTGGGGGQMSSAVSFTSPETNMQVQEGIILKSVGVGSASAISAIDDHFTAMPEPGSLFLLGTGMAGLFVMARKRRIN